MGHREVRVVIEAVDVVVDCPDECVRHAVSVAPYHAVLCRVCRDRGSRRRGDRAYCGLVDALDLTRLSPATLRLVQDARYRARLTLDLLQSDPSSPDSAPARDAIDAAVVEILAAAGLPRGPINGLIVENFNRGWFGRKAGVGHSLVDILNRSLAEQDRAPLSALQRQRTAILARRLFATERGRDQPDVEVLVATWKQVIG